MVSSRAERKVGEGGALSRSGAESPMPFPGARRFRGGSGGWALLLLLLGWVVLLAGALPARAAPQDPAEAVRPGLFVQALSEAIPLDRSGINELRVTLRAPLREGGWRVRIEATSGRGGFVAPDGSTAPALEWDLAAGGTVRLAYRPTDLSGRYEERIRASVPELGYVAEASFAVGTALSLSLIPVGEARAGRFLPLELRVSDGGGRNVAGSLAGRLLKVRLQAGTASGEAFPVLEGEAAFRPAEGGGALLFLRSGAPFGCLPLSEGSLSLRATLDVPGTGILPATAEALPVGPGLPQEAPLLRAVAAAGAAGLDLGPALEPISQGEPTVSALGRALGRQGPLPLARFARLLFEATEPEPPASAGALLHSLISGAERWGVLCFSREGLKDFALFDASGAPVPLRGGPVDAGTRAVALLFPRGERRRVRLLGNGAAPVRLLKALPEGFNAKRYAPGTWTREVDVYGDAVLPPTPKPVSRPTAGPPPSPAPTRKVP